MIYFIELIFQQSSIYHIAILKQQQKIYQCISCLIGCLMDQLEIVAEKVRHFKNITSYAKCSELCNGVEDCSVWTYFSGACILKNNMVYTTKNSFVTSGEKYCNDSGNIFYSSENAFWI